MSNEHRTQQTGEDLILLIRARTKRPQLGESLQNFINRTLITPWRMWADYDQEPVDYADM